MLTLGIDHLAPKSIGRIVDIRYTARTQFLGTKSIPGSHEIIYQALYVLIIACRIKGLGMRLNVCTALLSYDFYFSTEGSLDVELFFIPDNVPNDAFAPAEGISVCGNITNSTGQFGDGPFGVMLIPQFDNETSTVPSGSSLILVCCVCITCI